MPIERFSHLGLCVADIDASLRFYRDVLGFRERTRIEVSGGLAERLLQLPSLELGAVYLERDGLRLELLHFASPGHTGEPVARPMNGLGLTHLSLRVSDVDAVLDRVLDAGGRVLEETRMEAPGGAVVAVFVLDPDGTRIELVQSPGDVSKLPGE
ncbi:MAG: VOC family protein [Deltaproteobacteria bacterium]|nr:VOC family protein [Deltaproteobacteria bacterium]MBW2446993.1 VOC family protein [Deltaproteobacteria bacterium]